MDPKILCKKSQKKLHTPAKSATGTICLTRTVFLSVVDGPTRRNMDKTQRSTATFVHI
jgi:hypothetical protein